MKIIRLLLGFVLTINFYPDLNAQSLEKDIQMFFKSVVYVYDEKIATEKFNNREYEIWYKDNKTNQVFPKTYALTGSAFFVAKDLDIYLVTAEHVAKTTTLNTVLLTSNQNGTTKQVLLKDLIADTIIKWTTHPISDVSVIRLDLSKVDSSFYIEPIPFEIIDMTLEAPMRIRDVTVYGFPLRLGISNKITPITKTSKPSSGIIEYPRADNNKIAPFYLLDDPSVSGFSGGPVFELPQEFVNSDESSLFVRVYRLMGLVHGSISKDAGGFSAIVPGCQIKETIELAPGYNGKYVFCYIDGKIWSERIYKNGTPWTVLSNYDKNGNAQDKGTLFEGTGTLNIYDEMSKLFETMYYKNGILVKIEMNKK